MKTKSILIACLLCATIISVRAQDFKLAKSTGTLDIRDINHVTIEGTTGNEIIFSSRNHDRANDERAKGLRAISANGLEDNTGIGVSVIDKSGTYEVRQLKKMDGPELKILVPKGVNIVYQHTSPHGSEVDFKNVEGNIEVSTVHNSVALDNVTGVVNIKTVHGKIEANFVTVKNTIRIESTHGLVDVSIPVATKANVDISTQFGEILVDPDLKIDIDRTNGMIKYNDSVRGKINGGGTDIELSSHHSNVYLRKKL